MQYISESQSGFGQVGRRGRAAAGGGPGVARGGGSSPRLRRPALAAGAEESMAAGIELSTKAIKPQRRRRPAAPLQPAARTLALQPINTNVSFRDQAYSALKQ